MDIIISPEMQKLASKLLHCQDPKTGEQVFTGNIRIEIVEGAAVLYPEDPMWSTDNSSIDTRNIRP